MILSLSVGLAQADDNDNSIGSFTTDIGNDSPVFQAWFETDELISPLDNVLFETDITDIDNSSVQLNVSLFYTFSSFIYANYSVNMSFASLRTEYDNQTYRFEYDFSAQASGTYMYYYYQVYDGFSTVQKGIPAYFEIQWSFPPVTIERPLPPDTTYKRAEKIPNYLSFFLACAFLFFLTALIMAKAKSQKERTYLS